MSRQTVVDKASVMVGRNIYSQSLRTYAINPYTDGNYYSDCSSMVAGGFRAAGYNIPWLNSYGFESDPNFVTVPITQNGKNIVNAASVLKVCDVIIWPGHCNMVCKIANGEVWVQDHGADRPKIRKLSNVVTWNEGAIKVRRLKAFDDEDKKGSASTPVKTESAKPATTTNNTSGVMYRVQAGAFSNRQNAENYMKQIKAKGFNAFVTVRGKYNTVQCGAFRNKDGADAYADKLKAAGFEAYVYTDK